MKATPILACLLAVTLAAGCTGSNSASNSGKPQTSTQTLRPVTGETIKQVLLDDAALSKILGQRFELQSDDPAKFGGAEALAPVWGKTSPAECVGVTNLMEQRPYKSASVKNVARETWWDIIVPGGEPTKVLNVSEGVASLASAAEANQLFDTFAEQWKTCQGTTVDIDGGKVTFSFDIADVRVEDSVLATTVFETRRVVASPGDFKPFPETRAIGVRGNCLVEVQIIFNSLPLSSAGTGDLHTSAVDIARAMMDKISKLG